MTPCLDKGYWRTGLLVALHQTTVLAQLELEFGQIELADQSVVQTCEFVTVPGVNYTVHVTSDLEDWNVEAEIYGLGQTHSVAMVQLVPPDPSSPPPPSGWQEAGMVLREAAVPSTGFILSWPSLDPAGMAVTYHIDEALDPAWHTAPLSIHQHGTYRFTILFDATDVAPPGSNPALSLADEALLDAFETNLPEMTAAMQNAEYLNGALPSPPSQNGDQRVFRVLGDYSFDSDGDGSPDWLEFQVAANPQHPHQALANPFAADTDQNGTNDGDQIDSDNDGVVDSLDPADADVVIDWEMLPEPRYAAFAFLGPPESSGGLVQRPLCINNDGAILFPAAVWRNGVITALQRDSPDAQFCRAKGMNNKGEIVGSGFHPEKSGDYVCYWPDKDAVPVLATDPEGRNAESLWSANPDDRYPCDSLIDDDSRFIANSETGADPPFVVSIWQKGLAGFNQEPAPDPALRFSLAPSIYWGPEGGDALIIGAGLNENLPGTLTRFAYRPNDRLTAIHWDGSPPQARHQGIWKQSMLRRTACSLRTSTLSG